MQSLNVIVPFKLKVDFSFKRARALLFFLFYVDVLALPLRAQTNIIDSLKQLLQSKSVVDTAYVDILNQIALDYANSNTDSLIAISKKSVQLCQQLNYIRGEAEAVKNMGNGYRLKGDFEQAMQHYEYALVLSQKAGYQQGVAGCYNNIAIIYNNRGMFDDALRFHAKAIAIRGKIGDKKNLAISYNNVGVICINLGHYAEALDYYFKSLNICEQINYKLGIATAHNNIGYICEKINQTENALQHQVKALAIQKEVGDKRGMASSLTQLGKLYSNRGEDSTALRFHFQALQIAENVVDEQLLARVLLRIANIYFRQSNATQSHDYYNRAHLKMEKIGDKSGLSQVLSELAGLYLHEKKFKLALEAAKESLKIALEIRNMEVIVPAQQTLSAIYESMNNSKAALYHHKQFKTFSDSLNNKEIERKSVEMQARYEYQKKEEFLKTQQRIMEAEYERESARQRLIIFSVVIVLISVCMIALLVLKSRSKIQKAFSELEEANVEIQKHKEELQAMNALKERLLSVVSHDVRGPISSLRGMLQLLSQNAIPAGEEKKLISAIGIQLGQVRDFLDNLLHWVKHQFTEGTPDLKEFEISSAIRQTLELLLPAAEVKNLNLQTHFADGLLVCADPEMIKIVLRNLVSNAIKFCHSNDSIEILVDSNPERTFARVLVSDTGEGISEKNLSKLFGTDHLSTKGTNNEVGTGLGLLLCRQYVDQNGGELTVASKEGEGTQFCFTVPLAKSCYN